MSLPKWDKRFLNLAKEVSKWSKDPKKQIGAVIVSTDKRQFSVGYNGPPRGIDDSTLLSLSNKNDYIVHAEANAILNCPHDTIGWILYCTRHPCVHCAMLVIQSQMSSVVCAPPEKDSSWYQSQLDAQQLLLEAKVGIYYE